jgi:hypothetical protein
LQDLLICDVFPASMLNVKPTNPETSKTDFIRSMPGTMPVSEVIATAAASGMKISRQLVYVVRSRGGAKPAKAGKPGRKPRATVVMGSHSSTADSLLLAVASEIGLGRAMEILEAQRAQVRGVLRA